jgi:hypothetical protein
MGMAVQLVEMATWFLEALRGDPRGLAEQIERGLNISAPVRSLIVDYLRGHIKKNKGNQRTVKQELMESIHYFNVKYLQMGVDLSDKYNGKKMTRYRAIKIYLERNPDLNEDTLKTYLRRADLKYKPFDKANEQTRQ